MKNGIRNFRNLKLQNSETPYFIWNIDNVTDNDIIKSIIDKFTICKPPPDLTHEIKDWQSKI